MPNEHAENPHRKGRQLFGYGQLFMNLFIKLQLEQYQMMQGSFSFKISLSQFIIK